MNTIFDKEKIKTEIIQIRRVLIAHKREVTKGNIVESACLALGFKRAVELKRDIPSFYEDLVHLYLSVDVTKE